jgi:sigma-B regulation protein RsbU (phosphoserine phosphatase)
MLQVALARLVEMLGLETGWIFLKDEANQEAWAGKGYTLAAHLNLPPAMEIHKKEPWIGGCDCQGFCNQGRLTEAYNEVRCTRLAEAEGDRRGLTVHASTPLQSGERILGILNVAAPNWEAFRPEKLALLTNAGSHIGVALERARLYDLLHEQRAHEQKALLALTDQILSRLDLQELAVRLVEAVPGAVGADACALLLLDETREHLLFQATHGWHHDPCETVQQFEVRGCGLGEVLRVQRLRTFTSPYEDMLTPHEIAGVEKEGFTQITAVPLVTAGRAIGLLFLCSRRQWQLDAMGARQLRLMANQTAIAIEKARLHQTELAQQRLESELSFSRQIQLQMLPGSVPEVPGWDFAIHYQAARQVGGDFYDFFSLGGQANRLGLVIADVADKGFPAALYMAFARMMIRTAAVGGREPAAALGQANEWLIREGREALFLSAFYAVIEPETGVLTYSNGGHNRPIWRRFEEKEIRELAGKGTVLGILEEIQLEEKRISMSPGDTVLLYTDGVTEALSSQGEMFGEDRLKAVIEGQRECSAQTLVEAIVSAVAAFSQSASQSDDVTVLAVQRTTE